MKNYLVLWLLPLTLIAKGQEENKNQPDSTQSLSEVVIKGYESQRRLLETPASVGFISSRDLQRFSNISLVPIFNVVPGIRMEERSPGSYRLSIRGSLLRSPFGVRNVKVYWNDIPFTDGGGNTYLNLIDMNTVNRVEILKGPGGSIYGANTGGVVIFNDSDSIGSPSGTNYTPHQFRAQLNAGSYGMLGDNLQWKYRSHNFYSDLSQTHVQSDGYRVNSKLRKDVVQWNGNATLCDKDKIQWVAMYANLYYQTPGGLTYQQMLKDPRAARPGTPTVPGPVEQKAAVYNKTLFTGFTNEYKFNSNWSNVTSAMFSYTDFRNPFLTNYEIRLETNFGVRTKFIYEKTSGKNRLRLIGGAEWQSFYSPDDNYGNDHGNPDTVQTKDRLWSSGVYPFAQVEWEWAGKLLIQAGASSNALVYHYQRLTDPDDSKKEKKFDAQFLPRIAIMYKLTATTAIHFASSKGYSPPTIAEVRPSEGSFFTGLQPEFGWNNEFGFRGAVWHSRIQFDITAYRFKLQDAIVRRTDSTGAEYFVNAGGTNQKGIEGLLQFMVPLSRGSFVQSMKLWTSYSLSNYFFTEYKIDNKDYSGNRLTGVPQRVWVSGVDFTTRPSLYFNATYNFTSKLPLNDANSAFASDYRLLQGRIGWRRTMNVITLDIFAGIDNALNELYSLGNDINAFGARYYNPAPARNYFGGIIVSF
ncbi:MAG: TonB-dependent receptor [Bacteroidetes bacterium]|nr:MAG: TonB-dependent receptor [Bacteroidota bacterium]